MAKMLTAKPTQKVAYGALAGAVSTIVIWLLKTYAHIEIPGEVAAALTTVLTFLVSYVVPPGESDQVVQ
jgi:hypothetical protein